MQTNINIPPFSVPPTQPLIPMDEAEKARCITSIKQLLKQQDAVIIAHYYVEAEIQQLAEDSGGIVADSLQMARFGAAHPAKTLLIAGVQFMGESAKILSPQKRVLMPTLQATCSLDLGCPAAQFAQFCQAHPERTIVVYANTSAAVKALSDWVVTSSNALPIIKHLDAEGEKILWAPDRYLGSYIQKQTGADMLLWQGSCIVHEEFKTQSLLKLKDQYPHAAVLVHPESPASVVAQADRVGSTSHLLAAVIELPHDTFIVATDRGIFYKMQQAAPHKNFINAPTGGEGATCRSCGHCPWMAMNDLQKLEHSLATGSNEILLDNAIIERARLPLERMINFKE